MKVKNLVLFGFVVSALSYLNDEAKKDNMNHLEKSDTVLIKGSHSMNLSEITSFLKEICE